MKDVITIPEIAKILKVNPTTARVYLSRPEFAQFERNSTKSRSRVVCYTLNKNFIDELYLFLRRCKGKVFAQNLLNFWEENYKEANGNSENILELKEKIKNLETEISIISNHYEFLLNRYNELVSICTKKRRN